MSSELVSRLYHDLEDKILNNEFEDGHIITEQGIAKDWNVSRTPVREVFQLLSANGYLITDNKTLRIKTLTHKDILDIYDIRIIMEGLSGRLCAQNIDLAGINKLREIVTLQKMYLEESNTERIWELDNEFHQNIYTNSGNRLLQKMLTDFLKYTKFVRKHSYETEGRGAVSVGEHCEIFAAIKARDSELTEELLKKHAVNVRRNIINFSQ